MSTPVDIILFRLCARVGMLFTCGKTCMTVSFSKRGCLGPWNVWKPVSFYWNVYTKPCSPKWDVLYMCVTAIHFPSVSTKWAVLYMCVRAIDFPSVSTIFRLDFRTVSKVWYSLLFFPFHYIFTKLIPWKQNKWLFPNADLFKVKPLSVYLRRCYQACLMHVGWNKCNIWDCADNDIYIVEWKLMFYLFQLRLFASNKMWKMIRFLK